MKRALSLLLVCVLSLSLLPGCSGVSAAELTAPEVTVTPADSPGVNQALAAFGLSLLRDARAQEGGAVLLSPLSVALALSMAANGAQGDTLDQLEEVLGGGVPLDELNAACAQLTADFSRLGGSTKCSIANSLWCDQAGQIREDFVGKCRGVFDAQVFQTLLSEPAIVSDLNGWVSKHTDGMIPSIISQPFQGNTAALLVNALYLENTWAQKFDPNSTRDRTFTHGGGAEESVAFLNQGSTRFPYLRGDGVRGAVLPYDDGRLGFFALLPDGDLDGWLDGLEGDGLSALLAGAEETEFLHLALPKFEQEWSGSLTGILAGLGLDAAFDPGRADFSLLGEAPEGYYLSQVIHAGKIEVNEKGTKAAAATVVAASGSGAPPETGVTLVFDRPFLYGIADLETGVPLFLGTFE